MTQTNEEKKHISYSELKDYYFCSYYHHLKWILKEIKFSGNEWTLTGNAVHSTCEKLMKEEYDCRLTNKQFDFDAKYYKQYYKESFLGFLNKFKEENNEDYQKLDNKKVVDVFKLCDNLYYNIIPTLKEVFGEYELVECEHQLYQPIEGQDYNFKGFIDLIIKTPEGRYAVIDWKTCSWGWKPEKKSSKETTYQLTYYKHFYAKEMGIDPNLIDCYFVLLKRNPGKNKNIEIVPVSVGPRKIKNALEYLNIAVDNILQNKIKHNRYSCVNCECFRKQCNGPK